MAGREENKGAGQRRLQLVLGGLLVAGIVAAIVIALAGGEDPPPPTPPDRPDVTLPAQQTSDIEEAVEASGCELAHPPIEGDGHEERAFTAADYKTNPPTSGNHFPPPAAQDGIYEPGSTPELGTLVHALEHGRINVQYKPGSDEQLIAQLEALVAENGGYHLLLFENTTDMDAQVAATAWGHILTCDEVGASTWDALRTFRDRYVDKAPEQVP